VSERRLIPCHFACAATRFALRGVDSSHGKFTALVSDFAIATGSGVPLVFCSYFTRCVCAEACCLLGDFPATKDLAPVFFLVRRVELRFLLLPRPPGSDSCVYPIFYDEEPRLWFRSFSGSAWSGCRSDLLLLEINFPSLVACVWWRIPFVICSLLPLLVHPAWFRLPPPDPKYLFVVLVCDARSDSSCYAVQVNSLVFVLLHCFIFS
jgi:hypothetical protein